MSEQDATGPEPVLGRIKLLAATGSFRVTQHAQQEMVEEEFGVEEVLEAIQGAEILEDYPQHRRGACCLLSGSTDQGRPLHVVCTSAQPLLMLITVYEPRSPKWITPHERSRPL